MSDMYDGEPWAELVKEIGFIPEDTESSARRVAEHAAKRIEELEAHRDRLIERLECRNCTELQRKYEALVSKIRDAMEEYENSYEPETIELIDNISTLLEDDDG